MVSRPITIVQILPELITGGVEKTVLELGEYFAQQGHRSIVVSNGGPMVAELTQKGSAHIQMPAGHKNPIAFSCIPKLRRLLLEKEVDIFHMHSRVPAWIGFITAKTIPLRIRPKLITTFHGFYSINAYSAIMTKGEKVIAVSDIIKNHIETTYNVPENVVKTIHCGYDAAVYNTEMVSKTRILKLKQRWKIKNKKRPFLMLPGRFTQLKGHEFFIKALERIKHLPWTAILVGDENEKPEYVELLKKQVVETKLKDRIVFAGHCNDMPAAYAISDITISASIYPESFGKVAVESQAMGVPVIATALGGSKETIVHGKTGWLFPHTDVNAFADTLAYALSHKDQCRGMGPKAELWVREQFTTHKMCEKTMALYRELCSLDS